MKENLSILIDEVQEKLLSFTKRLIQTKSYTGEEANIAILIKEEMEELGYTNILIDKLGNVIGSFGNGPKKILFDSHMDTVMVKDPSKWSFDPFSGEIKDGKIYGRGAVDMKGALAATVYAGYLMNRLNLLAGKTVYIVASVMEEDYDGQALHHILTNEGINPNFVVICEPSQLQLALGHKGRALITITTKGVSAHGSSPEKGSNAIYKMNKIIQRVEEKDLYLRTNPSFGSLALSKVESSAVSLNAVPNKCTIYLDRRIALDETREDITTEIKDLICDSDATWDIYRQVGSSYRGVDVILDSYLPPWEIAKEHPLVEACDNCYRDIYNKDPSHIYWDFCTNGVASAGILGIPTIGFGPGDGKIAHQIDEFCPVEEIIEALRFYTNLANFI